MGGGASEDVNAALAAQDDFADGPIPGQIPSEDVDAIGRHGTSLRDHDAEPSGGPSDAPSSGLVLPANARGAANARPSPRGATGNRGIAPTLGKAGRSVLGKDVPLSSARAAGASAYSPPPPSVVRAAVVYGGSFTGPRGAAAALLGARAAGGLKSGGTSVGPFGAAAVAVNLAQKSRAGAVERARIKAAKKGLNLAAAGSSND